MWPPYSHTNSKNFPTQIFHWKFFRSDPSLASRFGTHEKKMATEVIKAPHHYRSGGLARVIRVVLSKYYGQWRPLGGTRTSLEQAKKGTSGMGQFGWGPGSGSSVRKNAFPNSGKQKPNELNYPQLHVINNS